MCMTLKNFHSNFKKKCLNSGHSIFQHQYSSISSPLPQRRTIVVLYLLFLLLCNDDIVGEDKEVERLLGDLSLSKELLFNLQQNQRSSPLQLSAHRDQWEWLQLTKVELFVDLMKLFGTLHLAGTIIASGHKLERVMEDMCVTVCVFLKIKITQ